jgi:collagenase-like PrtC family protease
MNNAVHKIELTAPAGGWEQLVAAVNAGADSIYLGYKKFGARAYAENFDMKQLKRAVDFSHRNKVKVYLTLNTLIKDEEIRDVIEFLNKYTCVCSDGIIVQDYGIYKLIKDLYKETPVHASTQMNIHNIYSLKLLKELGFKRAILAREMTLDEIKDLCAGKLLEIEVFGHGSQCYSYSGSCYFSSFIGGRSGNRGRCSQPCRMKYRLAEKENNKINYIITDGSYLFSKEDLCVLELLPSIIIAGVDALKIEGRMKSPEYVGLVTGIYRKYIDLYYCNPSDYKVDDTDFYKITQMFSRELGPGYLKEKYPKNIISVKKSGSIGNFLGRVYKVDLKDNKNSIFIKSSWKINRGDIIEIWTKKGNSRINIRDFKLIKEEKNKYKYAIELNKKCRIVKKDRVFKYFDRKLDDEAKHLFESSLNKYRSKKEKKSNIEKRSLFSKEINNYIKKFVQVDDIKGKKPENNNFSISVYIYDYKNIESAVREGACHIIYGDFDRLMSNKSREDEEFKILRSYNELKNIKVSVNTPSVVYNGDFNPLKNKILKFLDSKINSFKVSNPGIIKFLAEIGIKRKTKIDLYLSFNFNLFNSLSILFFKNFLSGGIVLKGVEFSPELNLNEIKKLTSNYRNLYCDDIEFSIFGHGYFPVMNSRYKLSFMTSKDTSSCFVEDLKGYRFPVGSDYNENIIIFNSKNFCTVYDIDKIFESGLNNIILDKRFFKEKEFLKIIKIYREAINMVKKKDKKKYSDFISCLKDDRLFKDYSKGHLMRGVE